MRVTTYIYIRTYGHFATKWKCKEGTGEGRIDLEFQKKKSDLVHDA